MQLRGLESADLRALINTDGTPAIVADDGYVTLIAATYLFVFSEPEAVRHSIHIITDAAIAGTFTIEVNNQPATKRNMGQGADVEDWRDTAAAGWAIFNRTTDYVAVAGTGFTPTALSLAKTAGIGTAFVELGPITAKRLRLKAAITTGGRVRVNHHATD